MVSSQCLLMTHYDGLSVNKPFDMLARSLKYDGKRGHEPVAGTDVEIMSYTTGVEADLSFTGQVNVSWLFLYK